MDQDLNDIKEDIHSQGDLLDPQRMDITTNSNEAIQVRPMKNGNKQYIFDTATSDYIDSLITDPSDTTNAVATLARSYIDNDDFAKVLEFANREDDLVFNTSKKGKIRIPMNDVFMYAKYLEREDRFTSEIAAESTLCEEDWLQKWKNSKKKNYDYLKANVNESFSEYLNRVKTNYNKSIL
jgi:hypothetical protein